jgi:hypothetical protein
VGEVVPEGAERAVDMRRLPAGMAIGAGQSRAAIEAGALASLMRLAGGRLDRAGGHGAGDGLANCLYPFDPHGPIMAKEAKAVEPKALRAQRTRHSWDVMDERHSREADRWGKDRRA